MDPQADSQAEFQLQVNIELLTIDVHIAKCKAGIPAEDHFGENFLADLSQDKNRALEWKDWMRLEQLQTVLSALTTKPLPGSQQQQQQKYTAPCGSIDSQHETQSRHVEDPCGLVSELEAQPTWDAPAQGQPLGWHEHFFCVTNS
jgi:hypothetical protein